MVLLEVWVNAVQNLELMVEIVNIENINKKLPKEMIEIR